MSSKSYLRHLPSIIDRLTCSPHYVQVSKASFQAPCLAAADVETNRTRVIILEVVERKVTPSTDLIRDPLSRSASARRNRIRVSRRNAEAAKVALLAGLVGVRSALGRWARQLAEVDVAATRDGEAGCLEVLLGGEEEDDAAGLARVGGWDVEVEDGARVAVDLAVV